MAAIGGIGLSTGLYRLTAPATEGLALRMIETLIAPAIGEEMVFRGLMIPDRGEPTPFLPALVLSEAVFVLWHVVEAETFLPAARPMFLRPDFLAIAALLGLACAILRRATGSLWPAVALHWTMVTLWQTFLGGFTL